MTIRFITILALLCTLSGSIAHAQAPRQLEKADRNYDNLMYKKAIPLYEKVLAKGYVKPLILEKLGNSYYFNAEYATAMVWYEKLYSMRRDSMPREALLRYAQSLNAVGSTKMAQKLFDAYKEKGSGTSGLASSEEYLKIISKASNRYEIHKVPFNSNLMDYGTFLKDGWLYFSSSRVPKKGSKSIDPWTNQPTVDLYKVTYDAKEDVYGEPEALEKTFNSPQHESSFIESPDGQYAYFTRSSRSKEKNTPYILKIVRVAREGDEWGAPQDLSINSDTYSNAHPALSPDGKTLYFASNRPGGFGQTDIYRCALMENGAMGTPENLGPDINTPGRESFPFVSQDNELYFSSDGHFGLGGFDVYYVGLSDPQHLLLNVGLPINSNNDDYAFYIDNKTSKGFFSSNRNKGNDDIYSLTEQVSLQSYLTQNLRGRIMEEDGSMPVENAMVCVENEEGMPLAKTLTDANGCYEVAFPKPKTIAMTVEKEGYVATNTTFGSKDSVIEKDFTISPMASMGGQPINDGLDQIVNTDKVFFDFNSSYLNPENKKELLKLVSFLKENPDVKINIGAHADSRGTEAYNKWISLRRGKRIQDFLVQQGIDPTRLEYKGYGEEKLLIPCTKGMDCGEDIHRENRRTVFSLFSDDE